MAAFNLSGYCFIEWTKPALVTIEIVTFSIFILVGYVVLWFYWKGRNWARWLVLITSLVAMFSLLSWSSFSSGQRIVVASEAAIAMFLVYWLNTLRVREYFGSQKSN